jgi:hypothetical protein
MPRADRDPDTVEEPRRREVRGALFRDTRKRFGVSEATLRHGPTATIAPTHIRVETRAASHTRMCFHRPDGNRHQFAAADATRAMESR